MKYIKIIEEVDFGILLKTQKKTVNFSMNFSTGSTSAFLKLVEFLGRKLISKLSCHYGGERVVWCV